VGEVGEEGGRGGGGGEGVEEGGVAVGMGEEGRKGEGREGRWLWRGLMMGCVCVDGNVHVG
jgi:hypothetical protein